MVTPYDGLEPGEVALWTWATLQRCDGVDLAAVDAFPEVHAHTAPAWTLGGAAPPDRHDGDDRAADSDDHSEHP